MVVQTRDPQALYDGSALDASEGVPEDDSLLAVPEGDDAALPSDDGSTDEAATEDDATDDETTELRAQVRAEIEQAIRLEEQTKLHGDFNTLKRTLESQKAQIAKENQRLKAEGTFRENWFRQYLTEAQNGDRQPDLRDYHQFKNELNDAVANVEQTSQQQVAAFQQWAGPSIQRMRQHVVTQSKDDDGYELFKPDDPEIAKLGAAIYYWAEQAHMSGDPAAYQNNVSAKEAHDALLAKKREQGIRARTAIKRQKTAQETAVVRGKQAERGVQNTSKGGGGSAGSDFSKLLEQAEREMPDAGKSERYLRAMELDQAMQARTRR